MEELQLIQGCKKQDRRSQQIVYERYGRVMYGICLRYSSDTETAQDLLHDGFIKVFTHIVSYEGKGSFEGWMKRIFINLALETIRKDKIKKQYSEDIENFLDADEIRDDSDDDIDKISESELMKMVQELPQGYRSVFNLYAIEEYSHKEISEALGIAEGTSRSQYIRARLLLQEKVKAYLKRQ